MKTNYTNKLFTCLILFLFSAGFYCYSQAPQAVSYQAVVRNSSNELVTETTIHMQVSILQGSTDGSSVYTETHTPETGSNGLVTVQIGQGTTADDFSAIDWSASNYFAKIEIDPNGGSDYTIVSTSQLLSVPYALYAKTVETYNETDPEFSSSVAAGITSADTTEWNNKIDSEVDGSVTNEIQTLSISNDTVYLTNGGYIKLPVSEPDVYEVGDTALGGIVFYVTPSGQHGLVAAKTDLGYGKTLSGETKEFIEYYNVTNACSDTSLFDEEAREYTDWRLPSNNELKIMYEYRDILNIRTSGNSRYYWSATVYEYMSGTDQDDTYHQWRYYINMIDEGNNNAGVLDYEDPTVPLNARCIRSF